MKLYMFRTVTLSIIRSLFTVHSAMVYVIQTAFEQDRLALLEGCLQTCTSYIIAECAMNKLLMVDQGTVRNM